MKFINLPNTFAGSLSCEKIRRFSSNIYLSTMILVFIVLFYAFPSYDIVIIKNEFAPHWDAIFTQVLQPFTNHNNLYAPGSHEDKLAFRFVPAILLKVLGIHSVGLSLIFQFFSLIIFYFLLLKIFNQFLSDKLNAFICSLSICFVISGHVYMSDARGIFDTVALDFMLVSFLLRNRFYVLLPLLLAYFTDERALLTSPAIVIVNLIELEKNNIRLALLKLFKSKAIILLIFSWGLYFLIRFSLHLNFNLATGDEGVNLFFDQINRSFYTLFIGLEGFLIIFLVVLMTCIKNKNYIFAAAVLVNYAAIFIVAQSVFDINRSMSYVILLIVTVLIMANKLYTKEKFNLLMGWVILTSIPFGSSYPFLAQIYRMKFITHSF
jgi:hypothetical protein